MLFGRVESAVEMCDEDERDIILATNGRDQIENFEDRFCMLAEIGVVDNEKRIAEIVDIERENIVVAQSPSTISSSGQKFRPLPLFTPLNSSPPLQPPLPPPIFRREEETGISAENPS